MVRYLLKRLGRGILTILLSVTLVFFIVRAMPSNPVDLMVSPQMSEEAQQALIEEFGLDQSKLTQYGLYMKELLHGNLGSSFAKRIPVSQYIAEKLPWTLLLLAAVMLIVILIGISVGLYAAAHKGKLSDRVISVLVTMGISVFIPFMAFLLLYIFSFKLKLLPTGGAYTPPKGTGWSYYGDVAKHLILPAIALSITNLANAVLYTRNSMIDVLHEDYIRTAYAKGNMLIDVSHCGSQTAYDAVVHSTKPIIMSHTGAKGVWNTKRLASDELIQAIAAKGGVVGIEAAPHTTMSKTRMTHDIDSYMEHFEYVKNLVGIDHVGFGVDCMYGDHVGLHHAFAAALSTGDTSKTTVPYQEVPFVKYLENPTEASWNIPRWLIKHGYTDEEIIKVLGGNAIRVLREVWS